MAKKPDRLKFRLQRKGGRYKIYLLLLPADECAGVAEKIAERADNVFNSMEGRMRESAHEIIYNYIRQMIAARQLKIGDALLPERELAKMFGLSRNSVRESLRALSLIGVVECRQGSGNYISERFYNVEAETLFLTSKLCNVTNLDITNYRCVMEKGGVMLATQNRTERQMEALQRCVEKMWSAVDEDGYIIDGKALNEADEEFHRILAVSSGNKLLQTNIEALSLVMREYVHDVWNEVWKGAGFGSDEVARLRLQEIGIHQEIIDAMRDRDLDAGQKAMQAHFDMVYQFL
ncbi:FadR/GntR family transcriptional regulator [uncultured Dysosmobacter sp.]|uniref:FadR/GntR family transcriptional regulator n=1 Tax=uncultured Dysosmobacter sp. TaxID=2591384 RepID=UPI002612DA39|nr:FCD domain-containing protein [uncultured Dysosmobacter sp.]